ncbi:MAG: hypothetical protein J6K89_01545 [Oscillospiraceae bacterium]|nr:hypothetical protein [Oscillospiraceae bacterium]
MDVKKKLVELIDIGSGCPDGMNPFGDSCESCRYKESTMCELERLADHLISHGVTVQKWIPTCDPPKEPGEYIVAQKHWSDGHLETKKGKWNGVEWLVDGRESLRVAYWMPLPEPPKGE